MFLILKVLLELCYLDFDVLVVYEVLFEWIEDFILKEIIVIFRDDYKFYIDVFNNMLM